MKQFFICLLALAAVVTSSAQTTATFESFDLAPESFLNDSGDDGGFTEGNIFLPNSYTVTPDYSFWSGWAISNTTDTLTPGPTNQYSAITGSGYNGSETYAVTFASPESRLLLTEAAAGGTVEGMYVTNSTYAYLSMLNGDSFTKKFGGETGDDPDYLLLTIKKYLNGSLSTDSVDFYLADYRFEDNTQDYLVKEWSYIDLAGLGDADSLQFTMSGSDVGQYGLNTPAYFCLDNLTTLDRTTPVKDYLINVAVKVFPNPTANWITIQWPEATTGNLSLLNSQGQIVKRGLLLSGDNQFDLQQLAKGHYALRIQTEKGWTSRSLIKQ